MNNVILDLFNGAISHNPNLFLINKFVDLGEPRRFVVDRGPLGASPGVEPSIISSKSKKTSQK